MSDRHIEELIDNITESNWRNRGEVVARPDRMVVAYQTKAVEEAAAWKADCRIRNSAALAMDAGEGVAEISHRFDALSRKDPGIAPALATFEAAYVYAASNVINKYALRD